MHLTTKGGEILFNKIEKVIKEANWEPSLDWDKMSTKFACIGTDMHLEMLIKEIEDKTTEITDSDSNLNPKRLSWMYNKIRIIRPSGTTSHQSSFCYLLCLNKNMQE